MRRILLLIITFGCFLATWAKEDYRYRNISMNDGLAANAVRNIVQDQYGFMWFGTDNGLCRYDGRWITPPGTNLVLHEIVTDMIEQFN